jgi:hypothetical protein
MSRGLGRGAVAAAAVAAALAAPAPGTAATSASWRGVVIAKDSAHHAVVTASAGGVVRTVRGAVGTLTVGQAITVRATQLRNGTFRASRITAAGRAATAQLRGVLIRYQSGRYLVSAGGSVLAVRAGHARRTAAASVAHARPGDKVRVSASLTNGALTAMTIRTLGHTGTVELEGIFLGLTSGGQVRLAVVGVGEVLVVVPSGLTLPTLKPGDELELAVTVDSAGALTLVRVGESEGVTPDDENADENEQADENDQGDDNDDQGDDDQGDDD